MLSFDPHQFAGRKSMPVHAEVNGDGEWSSTGLGYDDYRSMSTSRGSVARRHANNTPPFAMNAAQLQHVLVMRAFRVYSAGTIPADCDWQEVNRRATEHVLKGHNIRPDAPALQHEIVAKHRAAVQRAGGYMELQAAVAFRAWRLGQNSTQVAESLGMTPWNVRATLQRLREVALKLGYEIGQRHHSYGVVRKKKLTGKEQRARAAQLREESLALLPVAA